MSHFSLNVFKIFPLHLVLYSLNMMCLVLSIYLSIGVSHLLCLVFSELHGSIFWCLSFILKTSQPLLLHVFLIPIFSAISFWDFNYVYISSSDIIAWFFHIPFCVLSSIYFILSNLPLLFVVSCGNFYSLIYRLTNSFLD